MATSKNSEIKILWLQVKILKMNIMAQVEIMKLEYYGNM